MIAAGMVSQLVHRCVSLSDKISELDSLASLLDHKLSGDRSIAEPYILELTKAIKGDKKGKHLLDVNQLFLSQS